MERYSKGIFKMKCLRAIVYLSITLVLASVGNAFANDPEQKFDGFNLQGYSDDGEKTWDVNGSTANIVGSAVELTDVDANSYGERNMNLTANKGKIDQISGNMHLEKDVVITTDDGGQILTEMLEWHKDDDLVTTEEDVIITNERLVVTGNGLKAHPSRKDAVIERDVVATIDVNEKQKKEASKVTITSDGPMIIDQTQSVATFRVNVVAVQDDQMLKADLLEVYFDKDMTGLKKMICTGNVVITQGENQTYAERAVYDSITQKMTLTGRPKLILLTEGENGFASSRN